MNTPDGDKCRQSSKWENRNVRTQADSEAVSVGPEKSTTETLHFSPTDAPAATFSRGLALSRWR